MDEELNTTEDESPTVKPSIRQKKAFDKMVENGGSISAAMRDAGYSPNTAKTPSKLLNTKGFQELMSTYLPDELLGEKHLALLNKEEIVTKNNMKSGEIDVIPTGEIDVQAVKAGLDMAYKLKGRYAPTDINLIDKSKQTPEQEAKSQAFDEWYKTQL